MFLERLTVKRFKGLADLQVDLGQGVNIIKGPNEAGKSTVIQAMLTAIFGNAKSNSSSVVESKTWTGDSLYRFELLFSHDGHKYQLIRDFEAKQQELMNLSNGEKWVDKKRIEEQMTDIIGFTKESIFASTAMVQQAELARLQSVQDDITNLLETKVSGNGYTDVRNVIKQLKAQAYNIKKAGVKDPGLLNIERSKIEELENNREDITKALADFEEAFRGKSECEIQLPMKRKELEIKKKALAGATKFKLRFEQLTQEEKNLQVFQNQLNSLKNYQEQADGISVELKSIKEQLMLTEKNLENQTDIRNLTQQSSQLENEIRAKQSQLEQIKLTQNEIEKIRQQLVDIAIDEKVVSQAKKLQTDLEVYGRHNDRQGFRVKVLSEKKLQFNFTCDGETTSIKEDVSQVNIDAQSKAELTVPGVLKVTVENKDLSAEENLLLRRKSELELQKILTQNNCNSLEELVSKFNQLQELLQQKAVNEKVCNGLLQGRKIEDYVAELQQILDRQQNIREQMDNFTVVILDGENYQKLKEIVLQLKEQSITLTRKHDQLIGAIGALPSKEELEKRYQDSIRGIRIAQDALDEVKQFECKPEEYVIIEEALKLYEKDINELEAHLVLHQRILDQQKYGEEDLAKVEERIEYSKKRIDRYEKQLKILQYAIDGLNDARNRTVEAVSEAITKEVGKYITHITGGKYTKVRRKAEDLAFELFSPIKQDWLETETELSTGTRDQLYLLARLAVLKAISDNENLPVILDDTLAFFDNERRKRTIELLKNSINSQVIITTCHDHYDAAADNMIGL